MKIRIQCQGAADADIDELQAFQGDLKTLSPKNYHRLKTEIENEGFSEPISVWRDVKAKKGTLALYILNGHQRLSVLRQMREDGYEVPRIPISFVEAKDRRSAKRKVLALTSQYGQMTADGLKAFAHESELDLQDIADSFNFPEINLNDILKPPVVPQLDQAADNLEANPSTLMHECPRCGYTFK